MAADLIEVNNISKYNKGYKYLLTVLDVFSKHAWVEPIKNKTGQAVTEALEKILNQGRTPINLQTDDGKEFYNKVFQSLLTREGIHHFSTKAEPRSIYRPMMEKSFTTKYFRVYWLVKVFIIFRPPGIPKRAWSRDLIARSNSACIAILQQKIP